MLFVYYTVMLRKPRRAIRYRRRPTTDVSADSIADAFADVFADSIADSIANAPIVA